VTINLNWSFTPDLFHSSTVDRTPTLGCCEHRVVLVGRCGYPPVGDLTTVDMDYERVLNDTGSATFTFAPGDDTDCCERLGQLQCWAHELLIFRCSELVWLGPVVDIKWKRDTVTVEARDISAWLDFRIIHNDYEFIATDLGEIAMTLLEDAFGPTEQNPGGSDDACIMDNIQIPRNGAGNPEIGVLADFKVTACSAYMGDVLRELAKIGLDFTVLGRSLVIMADDAPAPQAVLRGDAFLADLEIEQRGLDAANYVCASGQEDPITHLPVSATYAINDNYYGRLERLMTLDHATDDDAALSAATSRVESSSPPPLFINVPDGAQLNPETGITFSQLVPGQTFNLLIDEACKRVTQQLRLSHVHVVDNSADGEKIGVGFSPLGSTGATAGEV
jgi:hypothetical protein